MKTSAKTSLAFASAITLFIGIGAPAQAHHSFAMYDTTQTMVFTGVVTRVDPAPNHLQIYFAPMNAERKNVERDANNEPIIWSVEMGGSAQMARQGISVNAFPPGTVFSVGLHPLRNGDTAGTRAGGLFKCPEKTPPAPGMHCDSVAGNLATDTQVLAVPVAKAE